MERDGSYSAFSAVIGDTPAAPTDGSKVAPSTTAVSRPLPHPRPRARAARRRKGASPEPAARPRHSARRLDTPARRSVAPRRKNDHLFTHDGQTARLSKDAGAAPSSGKGAVCARTTAPTRTMTSAIIGRSYCQRSSCARPIVGKTPVQTVHADFPHTAYQVVVQVVALRGPGY